MVPSDTRGKADSFRLRACITEDIFRPSGCVMILLFAPLQAYGSGVSLELEGCVLSYQRHQQVSIHSYPGMNGCYVHANVSLKFSSTAGVAKSDDISQATLLVGSCHTGRGIHFHLKFWKTIHTTVRRALIMAAPCHATCEGHKTHPKGEILSHPSRENSSSYHTFTFYQCARVRPRGGIPPTLNGILFVP